MVTFVQKWQGKAAWPQQNDSDSRAGKYWSRLVACAVVVDACAPRATVGGGPGAARGDAERAGAFRSTDTPYPVQGRANSPYQRLAPGSAVAAAAVFPLPVTGVGTVEKVVVVVAGEMDTLTAVAQLVVAAPLCWAVPARIASRSSPAALLVSVLVVAGVVVVLRFPLCPLYRSIFNQCLPDFYCCFSLGLI